MPGDAMPDDDVAGGHHQMAGESVSKNMDHLTFSQLNSPVPGRTSQSNSFALRIKLRLAALTLTSLEQIPGITKAAPH